MLSYIRKHKYQIIFSYQKYQQRMGNVQIESKGYPKRRKIFQQRRSVSPNNALLHRSLILSKNNIKREENSQKHREKTYSQWFKNNKKSQNSINHYRATLPTQRYKLTKQLTQRKYPPVSNCIQNNEPLTQRIKKSNINYYGSDNQYLGCRNSYKYHQKQFERIVPEERMKQKYPLRISQNNIQQNRTFYPNLTPKTQKCCKNYANQVAKQAPADLRCKVKLQKLRKIRNQIQKINQNHASSSFLQSSKMAYEKNELKQQPTFNYPLTERVTKKNKKIEFQEFQLLDTERKCNKLTDSQFFQNRCVPDDTESKKNSQFQLQNPSCSLSVSGLQENHDRCSHLVNKIKDFNDFLNEVKNKIKNDIGKGSKNKIRHYNNYEQTNQGQLRQDTENGYQQKDCSIVKMEKRSRIPNHDSTAQNLKSLNISLKIQNEKIQLQKYRKLFEKQLSKQHSIQKITIQDKKNCKGQVNRNQKILTIQYYDPQSNQKKSNYQEKTIKKSNQEKGEANKLICNHQVNKKYLQMKKNVGQLGILLGLNQESLKNDNFQVQNLNEMFFSRQKKESKKQSNIFQQSQSQESRISNYQDQPNSQKQLLSTKKNKYAMKSDRSNDENNSFKLLQKRQVCISQAKNSEHRNQTQHKNNTFNKKSEKIDQKRLDKQKNVESSIDPQKVNKRKKIIQELLEHVEYVNKKQQKIESTLHDWLEKTQPQYEIQSSISQY